MGELKYVNRQLLIPGAAAGKQRESRPMRRPAGPSRLDFLTAWGSLAK